MSICKADLWLHVRSVGYWTNRLYDYFDAQPDIDENGNLNAMEVVSGDIKVRASFFSTTLIDVIFSFLIMVQQIGMQS